MCVLFGVYVCCLVCVCMCVCCLVCVCDHTPHVVQDEVQMGGRDPQSACDQSQFVESPRGETPSSNPTHTPRPRNHQYPQEQ